MAVPGDPWDDALVEHLDAARTVLPAGSGWTDAHTHTGFSDPDGVTGSVDELLAGLDRAGHARAVVFTTAEPEGYPPANDRVLREVAGAHGRLDAFCRIDPTAGDPEPEIRRCLEAGARGIKLHPRSDAFVMSHPAAAKVIALADAQRLPVLIHAGRGIPALGEDLVRLAAEFPRAQLILAHAGISDLGLIAPAAAELGNVLFDTAWWQVSDLLTLFALVAPGQILYASDMPYGGGRLAALAFLRCAREAGHGADAIAAMAGVNVECLLRGEAPPDVGPPPGLDVLGSRWLAGERVVAYTSAAVQIGYPGLAVPTEPLALARLACQVPTGGSGGDEVALLGAIDALLAASQDAFARAPEQPRGAIVPALAAHVLAGTPRVAV